MRSKNGKNRGGDTSISIDNSIVQGSVVKDRRMNVLSFQDEEWNRLERQHYLPSTGSGVVPRLDPRIGHTTPFACKTNIGSTDPFY